MSHLAAYANNYKILKDMINQGIDVNAVDGRTYIANMETPLHIASFNGHSGIVKLLLNHGANASIKNSVNFMQQGEVPLCLARKNSKDDVLTLINSHSNNNSNSQLIPDQKAHTEPAKRVVVPLLTHSEDLVEFNI